MSELDTIYLEAQQIISAATKIYHSDAPTSDKAEAIRDLSARHQVLADQLQSISQ